MSVQERGSLHAWICPNCADSLPANRNGGFVTCESCGKVVICSIEDRPVFLSTLLDGLPKYDHRRLAYEQRDEEP